MIRGIHHVAINTADIERLVDFYTRVLGFEPVRPEIGPGWRDNPVIDAIIGVPGSAARSAILRAGTCYLELFEYSAPPAREAGAARPQDHGYTHFAIDVTDIDAEYRRLAEAGMEFVLDRPGDLGPIRAVYGKDPDGNIIEVLQTTDDHEFALEKLPGGGPPGR